MDELNATLHPTYKMYVHHFPITTSENESSAEI